MKRVIVLLALLLSGCALTELRDCTLEVSASNSGDVLRCGNHDPIALTRVAPWLRACILERASR